MKRFKLLLIGEKYQLINFQNGKKTGLSHLMLEDLSLIFLQTELPEPDKTH